MSDTHVAKMGDRGRLVVPVELRERHGLDAGTPLVLVDSVDGVVMLTRAQAKRRLRASLAGRSLVDELLSERREAADVEDEASG